MKLYSNIKKMSLLFLLANIFVVGICFCDDFPDSPIIPERLRAEERIALEAKKERLDIMVSQLRSRRKQQAAYCTGIPENETARIVSCEEQLKSLQNDTVEYITQIASLKDDIQGLVNMQLSRYESVGRMAAFQIKINKYLKEEEEIIKSINAGKAFLRGAGKKMGNQAVRAEEELKINEANLIRVRQELARHEEGMEEAKKQVKLALTPSGYDPYRGLDMDQIWLEAVLLGKGDAFKSAAHLENYVGKINTENDAAKEALSSLQGMRDGEIAAENNKGFAKEAQTVMEPSFRDIVSGPDNTASGKWPGPKKRPELTPLKGELAVDWKAQRTWALLDALEKGNRDWNKSIEFLKETIAVDPDNRAAKQALNYLLGMLSAAAKKAE